MIDGEVRNVPLLSQLSSSLGTPADELISASLTLSRHIAGFSLAALSLCAMPQASAANLPGPAAQTGVIGVSEDMLAPDYWIARLVDPGRVLLSAEQIRLRNAATMADDRALHELSKIPPRVPPEEIRSWAKKALGPLAIAVDERGRAIAPSVLSRIRANSKLGAISKSTELRYALAVRSATLHNLPSTLRAFPGKKLMDFDSLQAGVLFPGEAIVVAHASGDGKWQLGMTWQGPAWVRTDDIAFGPARTVFAYAERKPYRVVTGDMVQTVITPEAPAVSELSLDMGVHLPLASIAPDAEVNGAGAYTSWVIDLPVRQKDGQLAFMPALLRKNKDTTADYLPLTRTNIIRQAFKFLGERYGWGHAYNARDCSGLTSDVYRSMGLTLPPDAGAQGASPHFRHEIFAAGDSHALRMAALMHAQVGDLIVVPGHVLMLLGFVNGEPYVIQDVPFAVTHDAAGREQMKKLNGVSVTPLLPLYADGQHTYVDAMTRLVHVTALE